MKPGGTRVLRELPAVQSQHPSPFATSPKLQKHLKGTSTGCGKWKKSCKIAGKQEGMSGELPPGRLPAQKGPEKEPDVKT